MANDREKLVPSNGGNSAGSVQVDGRGRNVWQWNEKEVDSTTVMLGLLNNDALELEPTRNVPIPGRDPSATGAESKRELGIDVTMNVGMNSGFDPYNRS